VPKWKHYREVCEENRQPYLDGKITFDDALKKIAEDS